MKKYLVVKSDPGDLEDKLNEAVQKGWTLTNTMMAVTGTIIIVVEQETK